jgi:HSP20 family protein
MSARDTQLSTSQRDKQRGQQTGMSRQSSVPSVPALLLDPLSLFGDNPFSLIRRMQQDINRVFSSAGSPSTREGDTSTAAVWVPPIEMELRDNNLVVSVELPGINDEDIEVDITDDMLVVQGERTVERDENDRGVRRTERQYGRFYRAIALPDGADTDNATAQIDNGVLRITIPVAHDQSSGVRQIPIRTSASSQSGQGQGTQGQSSGQQQSSSSSPNKEKAA